MKLLNFDTKTLIMNNLRSAEKPPVTDGYTHRQYEILCNLIRQKNIEKRFFDFLLMELYDLSDWKELTYAQAYELIHILTYYDYKKERKKR